MLAIKKILFPTDFSECAEHAFSHAAELAAFFDAEVHVFHTRIRPLSYYPALKHLLDEAEKQNAQESNLESEQVVKAPVGDQVIVISAETTGQAAYEEIIAYSEAHDIDLIVMGTHGRTGPKRLFIGSTAERVVRLSKCPVLTLRSDADVYNPVHLKRILVPVDFSDYSPEAIRYAAELSNAHGSHITLLNVVEEAVLPTVYGVEPVSVYNAEHILVSNESAMLKLKKHYLPEHPNADTNVIIGHASTSITDFAEQDKSDLIVIPTHGLTGIKRFLLGSVAEHVARHAPCAVLTVKPHGKSLLNGAELVASASS